MKRTIPILITFFAGSLLVMAYFVPALSSLSDMATMHFNILAAIAFVLGGGNLLYSHWAKIRRGQAGWGYSVVTLVCFLSMLAFGVFKLGVRPEPGLWTGQPMYSADGRVAALAELTPSESLAPDPSGEILVPRLDAATLKVVVQGAEPGSSLPVLINDASVGTVTIGPARRGTLTVDSAGVPALLALKPGDKIGVGAMRGAFVAYGSTSGPYNQDGSPFWYLYQFGFQPLQQAMFAILAFYVASAAFRAFRARNVESVLLLSTAFVILFGRTFLGGVATNWLGEDPPWSYLRLSDLTILIMNVFNTAGTRAIMIGIALGIASTSLKVMLGIDRSYLGSDRG